MKGSTRGPGILLDGPWASVPLRVCFALLAVVFLPGLAAAAGGSKAPKANPHLASLQIEIWPEYDRPGALVILRAALAPDVALPVQLSLRIPASSGGPSAVAFSSAASGDLLNLEHETEPAGERINLKLEVPQRYFHIEYYDPIATATTARSYTHVWSGDLATDRLTVIVQEPAGVLNMVATPALQAAATGQDGLRYRSVELGALPAGKRLDVNIRYTKTDARTSMEILKGKAPETQTSAAMLKPEAAATPPQPFTGPSKTAALIWLASLATVIVLGGIAALAWRHWRKIAPAQRPGNAGFCRKCRAPANPGDRFCAACGAPLR